MKTATATRAKAAPKAAPKAATMTRTEAKAARELAAKRTAAALKAWETRRALYH